MSAETLRQAAALMREDVDQRIYPNTVAETLCRVADWLDSTANDVEHVHTPVYNLTSTTVTRALAVARRYLGES